MKKRLLLVTFILLTVLLAGFGIKYLLSLRKVTFTLDNGTSEIVVYTEDNKKVEQLSSDGHIMVQKGDYYLIPSGDNIASDAIKFTVGESDQVIAVKPPYTKAFLADMLKKERSAIKAAVAEKYPSLSSNYTLDQGSLYSQGDWFGGLLEPKISDIREQKDPYRVVLRKIDNEWEVIRRPEYILTSSRYEEVPVAILREVNSIVGAPGS